MSDGLRASMENSWRELGDIDRALERGEITE